MSAPWKSTKDIEQMGSFNSWKTTDIQIKTVGLCGILAWDCSYPTPRSISIAVEPEGAKLWETSAAWGGWLDLEQNTSPGVLSK